MRIFVSTLHALKLHDKLLLKYDMDMKATDIQRVICKCPDGPEAVESARLFWMERRTFGRVSGMLLAYGGMCE